MARDNSFNDYIVHDIIADFPNITSKPLFGGCILLYSRVVLRGPILRNTGGYHRNDNRRGPHGDRKL